MLLYIYASEIDKEKGITEKNNKLWNPRLERSILHKLEEKKKATRKKIIQVNELT